METYCLESKTNKLIIIKKELNRKTFEFFEDEMNQFLKDGIINIIVSFKDISYIISDAIRLLIQANEILKSRGGKVIVTDLNEYGKWALKTFDAYHKFCLVDKIDKAMTLI
jgi:anti-anti-sigma factor